MKDGTKEQGPPEKGKGEPVEPLEDPTRDDVHVVANRCPYCHESVQVEAGGWVSCISCQGRHHQACWDELAKCGSCGSEQRMVPEAAPAPVVSMQILHPGFLLGLAICMILPLLYFTVSMEVAAPEPPPPPVPVVSAPPPPPPFVAGSVAERVAAFYEIVPVDAAAARELLTGLELELIQINNEGTAEDKAAAGRALPHLGMALRLVAESGDEPWDADRNLISSWRDQVLDRLENAPSESPLSGELGRAVTAGLVAQSRVPELRRGIESLLHRPAPLTATEERALLRAASDVSPRLQAQVETLMLAVQRVDAWTATQPIDVEATLASLEPLRGGVLQALAPAALDELRAVLLGLGVGSWQYAQWPEKGTDQVTSGTKAVAFYLAHLESWRVRRGETKFLTGRTLLRTHGFGGRNSFQGGRGAALIFVGGRADIERVQVRVGQGQAISVDTEGWVRVDGGRRVKIHLGLPFQGAVVVSVDRGNLVLAAIHAQDYETATPPDFSRGEPGAWIRAESSRRRDRVNWVSFPLTTIGSEEGGELLLERVGEEGLRNIWTLLEPN